MLQGSDAVWARSEGPNWVDIRLWHALGAGGQRTGSPNVYAVLCPYAAGIVPMPGGAGTCV